MTGTYVAVPRVYVLGKKYGELGLGFIGLPGFAVGGGGGGVVGVGPMPHTGRLSTANAAHYPILYLEWFILVPIPQIRYGKTWRYSIIMLNN